MTITTDPTTTEATEPTAPETTTTEAAAVDIDLAEVERFAIQVATNQATASAGALAWIGDNLGLWATIAGTGPVTSVELATVTGLSERYLREWLASMHAVEYLRYDAETGRFTLPIEWAAVLADPTSLADQSGGFESVMGFYAAAERLRDAFRTGDGISWGTHDARLFSGVDRFFRPLYQRSLVAEWLPALDGMLDRLRHGARVLDVGCGHGASVIIMAQAFPASTFHGVDPHPESVEAARAAASEAGVADRVQFSVGSAPGQLGHGYDLACFFDSFHHVGDPVAAARAVREALVPDGALMLVEPKATGRVEDDTDLVSLTFYAASTLVCIPDAMAQGATDALGGQAGPERLAEVLVEAGFQTVRVAAEADVNMVVEARP